MLIVTLSQSLRVETWFFKDSWCIVRYREIIVISRSKSIVFIAGNVLLISYILTC